MDTPPAPRERVKDTDMPPAVKAAKEAATADLSLVPKMETVDGLNPRAKAATVEGMNPRERGD
jgi:hypothetical protein